MLDQARFRLLSGSPVLDCFSVGDYELVRDLIEQRLLSALCLTATPTSDVGLWEQLLADALAVSLQVQQDDGIESESMRNYSYKFKDYGQSWELLARKSGDLLARFNACDSGITFQIDVAEQIYGRGFVDSEIIL